MSNCGLQGAIIPDIPPEEGQSTWRPCRLELAPILIYSPTTSLERMRYIALLRRDLSTALHEKASPVKNGLFGRSGTFLNQCRQGTPAPGPWFRGQRESRYRFSERQSRYRRHRHPDNSSHGRKRRGFGGRIHP